MVKVIGTAPEQLKKTTCRNCAAWLEYTNWDVRRETEVDYTGGKETYTYIECPRCGHHIRWY